jgi:hypothetical protein
MHEKLDKGDIGLTIVIADLVKEGWIVSLPIQQCSRYDLIATKDSIIRRIQVKYRTVAKGAMTVLKRTQNGNAPYSSSEIDTFAVTNGEYIAYIPIQETSDKAFSIRVEPSKNNQKAKCKNVEDYRLLT